jgi:hypothetical protein
MAFSARFCDKREYAFPALGPVDKGDRVLVMTYTSQDPLVYDTLVAALREAGAERVDMLTWSDLGVRDPDERWSCADGWREINDRLGSMLSDGIEYKVEATALRGYLEQHPEYTAVYAGEAGGNHWRRTTSQRYRGSWLFSTYESLISRCHAFPDAIWKLIDSKLLGQFARAAAVHITDPQGTDVSWDVTPREAELWVRTASVPGHMLASTIQGVRRAVPVSELLLLRLPDEDCSRKVSWWGREQSINQRLRAFTSHALDHFQHLHRLLQARGRPFTEAQLLLMKAHAAQAEFEAMVLALTDEEFAAGGPVEGDWSARQVVEHMVDTEREYRENIALALPDRAALERR